MRLAHAVVLLVALARAAPDIDDDRRVHAFFYLWYGTPEQDGAWRHWDHEVLPHWTPAVQRQYPSGVRWRPPHDAHAPYYPARGLYSSRDPATTRAQLAELRAHGVGAVVLSWWGRPDVPGTHDTQGVRSDDAIAMVLDAAARTDVKVAFHLEPYHGRCAESVSLDLAYLHRQYGAHASVLRIGGRAVMYAYDSYHIPAAEWARVLVAGGDLSARGAAHDAFVIGLWLERAHGDALAAGGFDGAYTYFASDGASHGATAARWPELAAFCAARGLLFVPSVGPGYNDEKIRPWNAAATKSREAGGYYDRMWARALDARAAVVSVTSYNEWGEGTQIEPAAPRAVPLPAGADDDANGTVVARAVRERLCRPARASFCARDAYEDYAPHAPTYYLERTLHFSRELSQRATSGEL